MRSNLTRRSLIATALAAASGTPGSAQNNWPTRSIRVVVPLTAGGAVDIMARIVAQYLSTHLGQQAVVENQGGAGGTIASAQVAQSAPDGHTLVFQSVSQAVINPLTYKKLSYDPLKDLVPVSLVVSFPLVLAINPDLPAKTLPELIALFKANPGKYRYGSSGPGTIGHLCGELFNSMAGVNVVHVPYRGNSAIFADLFAGRVAMAFDGTPTQLAFISEGKVRPIGLTTDKRSPVLPDVPAIGETLKGYAVPYWTAMFAPARTPKGIIDRIAAETHNAVHQPDVVARFRDMGVEPIGSTPEELDVFWRGQLDYLGAVVKTAKIVIAQ